MSKNANKARKARKKSALAPAASALLARIEAKHGPTELHCECGWQLPGLVGLRFDDPSTKPASVRGFVVTVECPRCGMILEESLVNSPDDLVNGAAEIGSQDRIRCIEAKGADCTRRLPSRRWAA